MKSIWLKRRALIGVVVLAALLRVWAALQLPTDFDEPIYLQAGFDYAAAIRAGDLNAVIDYPNNTEHPPLVKLLYGATILALGDHASWEAALIASRLLSALFGVLAVAVVGLSGGPLAGFFLALHTLAAKYTSQAYLEALPMLASIVAVLAAERATRVTPPDLNVPAGLDRKWLWLSAMALGVTAAGKYAYAPIIAPIVYLAWTRRSATGWRGRDAATYVAVAAAVFFALDPALWRDPVARLVDSVTFHAGYTQSADVQQAAYPLYQPLIWAWRSAPWHPEVFFYFGIDEAVFVLAAIGLVAWDRRERRWRAVWIVSSLIFLLLWPTKWPQYTLVLIPALCLAAADSARRVAPWLKEQLDYWPTLRELIPRPPRYAWIVLVLFVGGLLLIGLMTSVQLSLARLNWSRLTADNSLLPSNTVYAILPGGNGEVILGTERGAVIWSPGNWIVLNMQNSGLPHDRVLAAARDQTGALWFGTQAGLARYDGEWTTYRAGDFGLPQSEVRAIEFGGEGRVWIGTRAGVAVFDGATWTAHTSASGLLDDFVSALAVEAGPAGDVVWIGTRAGVSRFDAATHAWTNFTTDNADLGWGGVADLMIDSAGRVWAATLGGGLSLWDGSAWRSYRTSNSALPLNEVQHVFEAAPGALWIGVSFPTRLGGEVAQVGIDQLNTEQWVVFTPRNSGYSGAEPLAIAQDASGRIWIGTRTAGVDVYQARDE